MPTVFTRRFGALSSEVAGSFTFFTAEADKTWILRDLVVTNRHGEDQLLQVQVGPGPLKYVVALVFPFPTNTSMHFDLRQELLPGETLEAFASLGSFTVLATGYELNA